MGQNELQIFKNWFKIQKIDWKLAQNPLYWLKIQKIDLKLAKNSWKWVKIGSKHQKLINNWLKSPENG